MSEIIPRARWGARHRNGVGTRTTGRLEKYLHHTVTSQLPESASFAQDAAAVRTVETIGQNRFGAGISYSFLITPSGRIFEGASVDRVSYHSGPGRNSRGVGICLVGNYDTHRLGARARDAVVWLLQEGVRRGWWGDPALTEMHRDFRGTACPGKHAAAQFEDINRRGRGQTVTTGSGSSGSAGSGSTAAGGSTSNAGSAATGDFLVGTARVPVHPAATRDRDPIGHVGAGHAIRRDPSRDTPGWHGVGGSWFVHKSETEPTSADESAGLYVGQWPGRALPGRDAHTWESHFAWVELLARVGYADESLTVALQKWLADLGEDVGPADGVPGPRTVRALQTALRKRGHYDGLIDGDRGPMTIRGELAYLNSQRSHLGSWWPQHTRAPRL
ncbi:peptidoglycan recognition family protein [Nesterenkonia sp. HG001]|uniref:peptidoglycan recognition protein family protein n=1 Tax=Nesterenkonia sp. HG001 TaxID=2983207 RepID=UPI002AC7B480|nr:peptidoglycan recognition family protein [Nesterenkonia sp. HG001]MDZ5076719.1 peptidoglycan recognition protein family protein [Nesterenkonia sp. HG001]